MAKQGVKYAGLHKRDSYEGLIDYLENKQDKLKLPDREAKFVRDSPQYQSLLNEGFLEVEKQQINQIKAEQEEHAVIRTASDTNETAKEVRVVSSQTDKPLVKQQSTSAGQFRSVKYTTATQSQTTPTETKSTSSQSSPQIFDMALGENLTKAKQEIESVENTTHQNKQQQIQNIVRMVDHNLRNVISPNATIDFAHSIASKGVSSLMKIGSVAFRGLEQLSASSSQEPQYSSLLLGDGRGKQDFYTMNPLQLNLGDKPQLIPISFNPNLKPKQKSKAMEIDDAVTKSKPKAKPKPKSMTVAEQDLFDEIDKNTDSKPKTKAKAKPSTSTSSSSKQPYTAPAKPSPSKQPVINKILKTKPATHPVGPTTGTQIPPSKIGIQKLREELENAKNKGKLSVSDTSTYMKHYDDWKSSKGDKAKKDEHLKGLRELYKQLLYKK